MCEGNRRRPEVRTDCGCNLRPSRRCGRRLQGKAAIAAEFAAQDLPETDKRAPRRVRLTGYRSPVYYKHSLRSSISMQDRQPEPWVCDQLIVKGYDMAKKDSLQESHTNLR